MQIAMASSTFLRAQSRNESSPPGQGGDRGGRTGKGKWSNPTTPNPSLSKEGSFLYHLRLQTTLSFLLCCLLVGSVSAQSGTRHAIVIGGLGGEPAYTEKFSDYLFATRTGLVEELGFDAANVRVLGERSIVEQPHVDAASDAETIRAAFDALRTSVGADDLVLVMLFGHGSYDGEAAVLNIPRRDLKDADYGELLDALRTQHTVFINTASASAPFIDALSASNRTIVTATRSGTQRNETQFPRHLVEALNAPNNADLDKDGNLSVRELFEVAAQQTAQGFEVEGTLATENALLDDNGDGEGTRLDDLATSPDGATASGIFLGRSLSAEAAALVARATPAQLTERDALMQEIASLTAQKAQLEADAYYAQLETLFVRLARLNRAIENGE